MGVSNKSPAAVATIRQILGSVYHDLGPGSRLLRGRGQLPWRSCHSSFPGDIRGGCYTRLYALDISGVLYPCSMLNAW
jgi:hypothetical protein